MLAENSKPAAQTGEDQSSPEFVSRAEHWSNAQAGLASITPSEQHDRATLSNLVHASDLLDAGNMEYSAGGHAITLADLITADDVVLIMSQRAQQLFGAAADGYPGVDKMQKGILDGALRGWITLCCPPDCLSAKPALDAVARVVIGGAQ